MPVEPQQSGWQSPATYFYYLIEAYSFERLKLGGSPSSRTVGYFRMEGQPMGIAQMQAQIEGWNSPSVAPSPSRAVGYRYQIRYTEQQARELLATGHYDPQTIYEKTLTLCPTLDRFQERMATAPRLFGHNPTRKGEKQTLREFCYYNGFMAAAGQMVLQESSNHRPEYVQVHPTSCLHLDSWLKGKDVILYQETQKPLLWAEGRSGGSQAETTEMIRISLDAFMVD